MGRRKPKWALLATDVIRQNYRVRGKYYMYDISDLADPKEVVPPAQGMMEYLHLR